MNAYDVDVQDNVAFNQTTQTVTEDYQSSGEIGNFTDLNDEISKISSSGNLTLKKDYIYNLNDSEFKDGIKITKDNIVIDGEGHSIDGVGQSRIFNINSTNVTLKNIKFVNGYSVENGGAIFSITGLNILNSTFDNNMANKSGGAVYIDNAFSNSKIDSVFINNAAYNGGAIYFNGETANNAINGYFKDNNAERAGGSIFVRGKFLNNTIASEFYNNRANQASGGAIFFYSSIENNVFESIFRYNYGVYGGAILFYKDSNNNKFNSDFRFNVAKSCGGAMFFYNTDNNTFSGYFINNSALGLVDEINGNGGAITFKGPSSNSIFNCDFVNNTAAKTGGGVNYRETPSNITFNTNFINNRAKTGGGVNFFESFENVLFNGEFVGNSAEMGGAIAAKSGVIQNMSFENNHAEIGGAVYFEEEGMVDNSYFANNSAANYGGAIYFNSLGTIDGSNFTNSSSNDGGAILANGNLTINNSLFKDNIAVLGTNHISLKGNSSIRLIYGDLALLKPFYLGYLTILNVSDVKYGETIVIDMNLTDESHNPFDGGTVSVIIGSNNYSANVENGSAEIAISELNAGNYTVSLTYDGYWSVPVSQVSFKVLKQNATIDAQDKSYIINYGGKYSITLKDVNGIVLSDKQVAFTLNGKSIGSAITNSDGVATISLNPKVIKSLKSGKKNLVVKLVDSNYNAASKTVKIILNKEKTKIVAKNKKFKKIKKTKKYSIILKNSKGKAFKKAAVTLKVKGKTYKAKTKNNGKATFKITKLAKKGKYTAVIKYKGSAYYKKATKTVKITVK